jgi:predicted ester cyclase
MWRTTITVLSRALSVVILVCSVFQISLAQDDTAAAQHKETLRSIYDTAIGKGDVDLLDAHYSADYVNHGFGEDLDLSGFKGFVKAWVSAMPDFSVTPEVIIANKDDEWAASRVVFSGTFSDKWVLGDQVIEPNNKAIQISFNILHRFDDSGKIAEDFTAFDPLSMLLQMDAAPKLPDLIAYTLVTGKISPIVLGEPVSVGMEQAHKEGYAGVIDDSLNKGDLTAIDKYMVEDYLTHEPFGNFTRDTFKKVVQLFRQVVPDLHVAMEITVAEGDWLAGRLVYTGTFKQSISQDDVTLAASGKPIKFIINVFVRFNKDGIGIEDYKEYNRLGWLQQLGLVEAAS